MSMSFSQAPLSHSFGTVSPRSCDHHWILHIQRQCPGQGSRDEKPQTSKSAGVCNYSILYSIYTHMTHATPIRIHSSFLVIFLTGLRARTNAVEHRFNLSECCHVVARMSILTPATSNQVAVIMVTIFSIRMKLKISGPRSRYRGSFTAKKTFSRSFIWPRPIPENGQQNQSIVGLGSWLRSLYTPVCSGD